MRYIYRVIRLIELEQVRTRIAADLHDDIGANLTTIAVLSEVVQGLFLPHRSGDVLDAVADLTGVALGVLVGTWLLGALQSRAAGRSAR